jgi:hypothetical protein
MNDVQTQKLVDSVADATRSDIGEMSPEQLDLGWQRLERSLSDGRYPSVPIVGAAPRWWLRGFALAAAALVLGFATHRLVSPRPASPLHYVLEGATLGPGETIQAGPVTPASLVFSDDSRIRLAPRSRVSVLALDSHGSRVALADGELDVQVQHRPDTSWRFEAGPFRINVRGTSFHLTFEAERGRLALQMLTGVVEARGPSDDRVFTLRAGESLELFAAPGPKPAPAAPAGSQASGKAEAVAPQPLPEPATPRLSPPPARHRAAQVERAEVVAPESGRWARLIAQGEFTTVVKDAENRGLDATLASASAADLTSLADAARYTRHDGLARRALLGVRARFPGTARAGDAAFFLGRLAELPPSSSGAALGWYDTYLGESGRGPYAGEALGREISLLSHTDRVRARKAAQIYLERFPHGTQADLAKSLLESAPE